MRCLIRNVQALFALLILGGCINALAEPYTPPIGSPERIAIANAVRASLAQLGGEQFTKLAGQSLDDLIINIVILFSRDPLSFRTLNKTLCTLWKHS